MSSTKRTIVKNFIYSTHTDEITAKAINIYQIATVANNSEPNPHLNNMEQSWLSGASSMILDDFKSFQLSSPSRLLLR